MLQLLHTHTPLANAKTLQFRCGRLPAVLFIFFFKIAKRKAAAAAQAAEEVNKTRVGPLA
jgi:hypothetical protein